MGSSVSGSGAGTTVSNTPTHEASAAESQENIAHTEKETARQNKNARTATTGKVNNSAAEMAMNQSFDLASKVTGAVKSFSL